MKQHALATLAYTAFWLATRWPAIRSNTLFFDDFAVPLRPALFYIGSYRPLVWLEYRVFELFLTNHLWTVLPKITGALYFGASAALFAALLRRWNVAAPLAYAMPLVMLGNVVLNDSGLWNSLHALPLAIVFLIAGMLVWESNRWILGTVLIFVGLNGYQIFAALVLLFLATEPFIKRLTETPMRWRHWFLKIALSGVAAVVQIIEMLVIRPLIPGSDERGFGGFASLSEYLKEKLHGVFDLAVNGIMPTLAYYTSAAQAMSLWKYALLAIGVITAIALRRKPLLAAIGLIFPLLLFLLPAAPVLIMKFSPYAWRVSTPTAFALALMLTPLLIALNRAGVVLAVVIAAILTPAALYEAQEREKSFARDEATLRAVKAVSHTVVYAGPRTGRMENQKLIGPRDLTAGYERLTPAVWSSFNNGWFAQHYIETYHRLRFTRADSHPACNTPGSDVPAPWPRVKHLPNGVSTVCVQ
jgi:hypothetical protein